MTRKEQTYLAREAVLESSLLLGLKCPNGHALRKFNSLRASYACDMCKKAVPVGTVLYGCRICNHDLCESCAMRVPQAANCEPIGPRASPDLKELTRMQEKRIGELEAIVR